MYSVQLSLPFHPCFQLTQNTLHSRWRHWIKEKATPVIKVIHPEAWREIHSKKYSAKKWVYREVYYSINCGRSGSLNSALHYGPLVPNLCLYNCSETTIPIMPAGHAESCILAKKVEQIEKVELCFHPNVRKSLVRHKLTRKLGLRLGLWFKALILP